MSPWFAAWHAQSGSASLDGPTKRFTGGRRSQQTGRDGSHVNYGSDDDAQVQSSNALKPVGKS